MKKRVSQELSDNHLPLKKRTLRSAVNETDSKSSITCLSSPIATRSLRSATATCSSSRPARSTSKTPARLKSELTSSVVRDSPRSARVTRQKVDSSSIFEEAVKVTPRGVVPKVVYRRSALRRVDGRNREKDTREEGGSEEFDSEEEEKKTARTPIPRLRVRRSVLQRCEQQKNESKPADKYLESEEESEDDDQETGDAPVSTPVLGRGGRKACQTPVSAKAVSKKKVKSLFATDASVVSLVGREKEFNDILKHVEESMDSSRPLSIYISGAPGTGKTASVRLVLKALRPCTDAIIINCSSVNTVNDLLKTVFASLGIEGKPSLDVFTEYAHSLTRPLILVLDEIDHLTSKTNSILYAVFKWPQDITSRIIILGIANSIDLTERLLPKLKLSIPPVSMVFAPYATKQITQILTNKMMQEKSEMDAKAIELCARKVAAVSGDLRSALIVMKQAKSAGEPGTPSGCREVLGVLQSVYSSPLAKAKLPLQPRLLLTVCLKMSTGTKKKKDLTRSALFSAYSKACTAVKIPSVSQDDLEYAFNTLEAQSFLSVSGGDKIRLQVDASTARSAIADNHMIQQINQLDL